MLADMDHFVDDVGRCLDSSEFVLISDSLLASISGSCIDLRCCSLKLCGTGTFKMLLLRSGLMLLFSCGG